MIGLNLKITTIIKDSFQEYKDEQSLVLFSKGCNLDCYHCYNKKDIEADKVLGNAIDIIDKTITPMHTAVVLLGGEPTIHNDILNVCEHIKKKNLKIKIFSNGINIDIIESLCNSGIVDAWSIDLKEIKNVKDVLRTCITDNEYLWLLNKSILNITKSGASLELRTTIFENTDVDAIKMYVNTYYPCIDHIIQKDFYKNIK